MCGLQLSSGPSKRRRQYYSITRSIARSTTQILRDTEPFGNGIWPSDSAPQSVTERTISMLKGEAPALAASALTFDIGVDVSRSMIMDERGPFAYNQATAVLRHLPAAGM